MLEAYVIETPVGLFVLDDQTNVIEKILFSPDPQKAAAELKQLQSGQLTPSMIDALKKAAAKYSPLVFEHEGLARTVENQGQLPVLIRPTSIGDQFRNRLSSDWDGRDSWIRMQSLESPHLITPDAYNDFVRQITLQIARAEVARAAARRDLNAVQAVRAMDDLDKTLNLIAGRVREWYGLHFPEMDRIIEKHETYARLISKLGKRESYTPENVIAEGLPKDRVDQLAQAARKSMGAAVEEHDLAVLQSFCELMLELYKFREKTQTYVEDVMKQVAPNMTAIVGPALSARLISIAGSLENLAKMPASTLQVLGAEKALFRALKTGARPPKHGVLFQYTAVHQSPRWQRGKIARTLAGKLSIAARIDAFGGNFMGDKLKADFDKKAEEIKQRYASPPGPSKKKEVGRKR